MGDKSKKLEAIVFIDGNNLYHNLKSMGLKPSTIDLEKLSDLACAHFGVSRKKSIYYNSVPSIEDGEQTYYKHMNFLSEVRKLKKFEVKTRKLQRQSTKQLIEEKKEVLGKLDLCDSCRPVVETNCFDCIGRFKEKEKGIDVMIAVDMLNLCIMENKCDCCVLISGDADFLPAAEIIKKHGKEVLSAFVPVGYSNNMRRNLRFWVIGKNFIYENCSKPLE